MLLLKGRKVEIPIYEKLNCLLFLIKFAFLFFTLFYKLNLYEINLGSIHNLDESPTGRCILICSKMGYFI